MFQPLKAIRNYLPASSAKSAKPAQQPKKNAFEAAFSLEQIGTGGRFVAGSEHGKMRGLRGALRNFKAEHLSGEASNLSKADLGLFYDELSKKLKAKSSLGSSGLTGKDARSLLPKFREYVRKGIISSADFRDFKNIVKALSGGEGAKNSEHAVQAQPISKVVEKEGLPTVLAGTEAQGQKTGIKRTLSVGLATKPFLSPLKSNKLRIFQEPEATIKNEAVETRQVDQRPQEKKIISPINNVSGPLAKIKETIGLTDLPID